MNLILLEPHECAEGAAILTGDRARHVTQVLKATPGFQLRVGVVDGPRGIGTVRTLAEDRVELACVFEDAPPPRPAVDLLLALPRPKVMRRLWAQLASLGVGRIILTNASRVERPYFDTHVLEPGCYRPLLVEGLQQARDTRLPEVSIHRQFKILVEDDLDRLAPDSLRIAAHPGNGARLTTVVDEAYAARVLLAVGPEGGWNDFEQRLLEAHGFTSIDMGPRTLRSDTACVALLALAHDALRA